MPILISVDFRQARSEHRVHIPWEQAHSQLLQLGSQRPLGYGCHCWDGPSGKLLQIMWKWKSRDAMNWDPRTLSYVIGRQKETSVTPHDGQPPANRPGPWIKAFLTWCGACKIIVKALCKGIIQSWVTRKANSLDSEKPSASDACVQTQPASQPVTDRDFCTHAAASWSNGSIVGF